MRLAFAVIAHVDADILIVDEALAVGDSFFVQKCMRFIKEFKKNNILLFVSHSPQSINELCKTAIWLHNGQIKQIGTPKTINESYTAELFGREKVLGSLVSSMPLIEEKIPVAYDMRRNILNSPCLRNDLLIGDLNLSSGGVGSGKAVIRSVEIHDSQFRKLSCIVGGEAVILEIKAEALDFIFKPIIGFSLKNHLGVIVFGDNTYLSNIDRVIQMEAREVIQARFHFHMPRLPGGDYMIEAAIAEGAQDSFEMVHKIPDALSIKSTPTALSHGQLSIPATHISLDIVTS